MKEVREAIQLLKVQEKALADWITNVTHFWQSCRLIHIKEPTKEIRKVTLMLLASIYTPLELMAKCILSAISTFGDQAVKGNQDSMDQRCYKGTSPQFQEKKHQT